MARRITEASVLRVFNAYITKREAGNSEYAKCCSCGAIKLTKQMDRGHFVNGRTNSILFEPTNVHLQCRQCNRFLHGNWSGYYQFMLNRYGQEEINRLVMLKNVPMELDYDSLYLKFKGAL